MFDQLKRALQGHYEIERELGRGGMASVFLAHDVRHGRSVAIKVLHPELAAAVGAQRFVREIETVAKLTHPHILTLHEAGELDGFLYYVMPYIEGETLRERLTRTRQLPLEEALRIASDVADALSYAHEHGIIHRDIKPENILLSGRHAIVADFGIARAVERAAGNTLTETGVTLGTPHYMSPEQASGEREVDSRSDIYALGCVLYEMLSGEPPFSGPTIQSVVAKHLTAGVPSVRMLRPTVPAHVERAITHALAKSPADRQPDAQALLDELEAPEDTTLGAQQQTGHATSAPTALGTRSTTPRWIVGAGLIAALGAVAIWGVTSDSETPSPDIRLRALAVLPFDNVGGSAESTYFADGITEEIIDALGRIPGLRVISRTSAFAFKEKRGLTLRQIADSLQVGAILEGSVNRQGDQLRVIARLIDIAADSQLLTRDFNREVRDVFALQNEIAQDIAAVLRVHIAGTGAARPRGPPTHDVVAYDLYLRGRALWNQLSPSALREAVKLFEQAIARDSTFVAAYVGLSDARTLSALIGGAPRLEAGALAVAAAEHALRLDSLDGRAHAALGHALYSFYRDRVRGEFHMQRALALDSINYGARLYLGILRHDLGSFDEAIALLRDALERDPLAPAVRANLGRIFMGAGRLDSAITHLQVATSLAPRWSLPHTWLGHALVAAARPDEAIKESRLGASLGSALDSVFLAYTLAASGQRTAAEDILRVLTAGPGDLTYLDVAIAMAYSALGQRDEAFRWLERHMQPGGASDTYLRLPGAARLRADPRFADVRRRLRLER